ncbi:MAG: zf-HC2 domain-containing protein [Bryobacteraceae bacterium]
MKYEEAHVSDQLLLLNVDGELSKSEEKRVRSHLESCWKCRTRSQELQDAIMGFVRSHQSQFDERLPPIGPARAMLRAKLSEAPPPARSWFQLPSFAVAVFCVLAVALFVVRWNTGRERRDQDSRMVASIPDSRLTPGAAVLSSRQAVCAQPNMKNKAVPVSLQRRVFEEYGIAGAEPKAYEIDYLVTPALGGADDIHNLWPHSYSATVWNAQVKDDLEDRMREMVCDGTLDLGEAQREISTNWIVAYKKYFHTDRPVASAQ